MRQKEKKISLSIFIVSCCAWFLIFIGITLFAFRNDNEERSDLALSPELQAFAEACEKGEAQDLFRNNKTFQASFYRLASAMSCIDAIDTRDLDAFLEDNYALVLNDTVYRDKSAETAIRLIEKATPNGEIAQSALAYLAQFPDKLSDRNKDKIYRHLNLFPPSSGIVRTLKDLDEKYLKQYFSQSETFFAESDEAFLFDNWQYLPQALRSKSIEGCIDARFVMQTSGSAQLPQLLNAEISYRFAPPDGQWFVVTKITDLSIGGKTLRKGSSTLAETLNLPVLSEANHISFSLDLQPWLTSTGNVAIKASGTAFLVPDSNIDDPEKTAILKKDFHFSQNYRVFLGVVTGAPHRIKENEENRRMSQNFSVDLCNDSRCDALWQDGKKADKVKNFDVEYGKNLYLAVRAHDLSAPVAARLVGHSESQKSESEIASFWINAPQTMYAVYRAEISLESLCPSVGQCLVRPKLKPSLRMGRRNPHIKKYWGDTLDLPEITFNILKPSSPAVPAQLLEAFR